MAYATASQAKARAFWVQPAPAQTLKSADCHVRLQLVANPVRFRQHLRTLRPTTDRTFYDSPSIFSAFALAPSAGADFIIGALTHSS